MNQPPAIQRTKPTIRNLIVSNEGASTDTLEFMPFEWDLEPESPMDIATDGRCCTPGPLTLESNVLEVHVAEVAEEKSAEESLAQMDETGVSSPVDPKKVWQTLFAAKRERSASTAEAPRTGQTKRSRGLRSDERLAGPVGLSKAAQSEKAGRAAVDRGDLDRTAWNNWQDKIRQIDDSAQFDENRMRVIVCSSCKKDIKAKRRGDTERFLQHYSECIEREKAKPTSQMNRSAFRSYFTQDTASRIQSKLALRAEQIPPRISPCPGITPNDHSEIRPYLLRTSALGGGGRSITMIAKEHYSKTYGNLSSQEKDVVIDLQQQEWTWNNDFQRVRLFSTKCLKQASGGGSACQHCENLLKDRRLLSVLRRPTPNEENLKFVNVRFRNAVMGEKYARIKGLRGLIASTV